MTNTKELVEDTSWGSFSSAGLWNIEQERAEQYSIENQARRAQVNQYAYELLNPKRIPPLTRLFVPLARVLSAVALWYCFDKRRGKEKSREGISRKLRKRFVKLGSAYIKLGQIISSGENLFPSQLVDEFKLLRDQVPPEPYHDIVQLIEEELGRPLESVFSYFEREPLAAASIAQVHNARLITGETVVVKVQRPKVKNLVHKDIAALAWLAPRAVGRIPITALANPPALVELFSETICEELDFRLEADNMLCLARVLAKTKQRSIIVPRPYLDIVTERVLVMEKMDGYGFDDVDSMKNAGIDTKELLHSGLIAFMEGALLHGLFHGDLHGGNLFVQPDGKTALMDFGITGRFNEQRRKAFMRIIIAGTSGNIKQQVIALRDLGAFPQDVDIDQVIRDLDLEGPVKDPTKMSSEQLTAELSQVAKKLLGYGAHAPKELMLFVKNLVFLDGATARLAPDIDILEEINQVYMYFVQTYGAQIVAELGISDQELKEFDTEAVLNSMGIEDPRETLTYQDVLKRREIIKKRMANKEND